MNENQPKKIWPLSYELDDGVLYLDPGKTNLVPKGAEDIHIEYNDEGVSAISMVFVNGGYLRLNTENGVLVDTTNGFNGDFLLVNKTEPKKDPIQMSEIVNWYELMRYFGAF